MSVIGAALNFQCDLCGFKTSGKGILAAHTKKEHKGRKYNCELCDYSTTGRWPLENHIKTNLFFFFVDSLVHILKKSDVSL